MHVLHFGKHSIPLADVHDIHLEYNYQEREIYIDLEISGGAQMSLNLPDSLTFMEEFIKSAREIKGIAN